jgi:hypothetical protein
MSTTAQVLETSSRDRAWIVWSIALVGNQVGAPTCAFDLAEAPTRILAGMTASPMSRFTLSEAGGTYYMTASGQTTPRPTHLIHSNARLKRLAGGFAGVLSGEKHSYS